MTDFLGRLVSRVLAPERLLRPRTHSLYESFPAAATLEEIAPAHPSESGRIARRPAVADQEARPSERSPRVEPAVERSARRQWIEDPPSREPEPEPGHEHEPEREREREHPRASEPEAGTVTIEKPIIIERDVVQPPEVRTVVRTRRGADRIERLRLRSERTRVERELVSEGPIEITIGRIDVRAIVDSPREAPRAARAPQPQLSLRDYLSQRDARRRR